MKILNWLLDFLLLVLMTTAQQLIGILGVFFLFGILLYVLSRVTRNLFNNAGRPNLDIFFTGWIGTPVHELGHAVFCIIFRHRIIDMKLFSPNSDDGSLGYVNHAYNPKSSYQSIGNFFIGAGPIIFGTFVLYALIYFLLPNHEEISVLLSNTAIEKITVANLLASYPMMLSFSLSLIASVFSAANLSTAGFWVFLYLSLCVSSHMALSPPDLKSMLQGLLFFVALLFFANVIPLLLKTDMTRYVMKVHEYTAGYMSLFILATLISLLNFALSYIVVGSLHYIKYRSLLSIR